MTLPSQRITRIAGTLQSVYGFFTQSTWARRREDTTICDFTVGNPHEMPLEAFSDALGRWSAPQNEMWYAYHDNTPAARAVIAASLRERRGQPFEDDDIFLTNGAFAGLASALTLVTDPGDEVIFLSPPWFFYEALITAAGGVPVRVRVDQATFDLDLGALEAAITSRTRAIIVNSPNNPTGRIYSPATLTALSQLLADASARNGRPIYLLSDEAYCRILYDGNAYHSPSNFYPNSFVIYTYGKTLLTPGQRMGYIALPPTMLDREDIRSGLFVAQLMTGYAFPNALLQHALPDLEQLSIDIPHLQRKRDRLVAALREMGYRVHVPEATFYLLPRSPLADDLAFTEVLAQHDVFCLP
ncbi:MAG TPA: aminotransferase class I/II-fold pyridoxal phosphate-dependent enzyme, partial [Ktedonobacterales bacterium]|nr:aminotransferase class I/II-fold pyridoxal phosphate-dependent enzyme [Ktedonobacterales bacterium]